MDRKLEIGSLPGIVLILLGALFISQAFVADRPQLDPQPIERHHPIDAVADPGPLQKPISVPILAIFGALSWVAGGTMLFYDHKTRALNVIEQRSPWRRVSR